MTRPVWCHAEVWDAIGDMPVSREAVARAILSERERCYREIDRANERLGNLETPLMRGDNLAITLCTHFDDGEPSDDDTGWSEAAIAGYEEVTAAIRGHYSAAIHGATHAS